MTTTTIGFDPVTFGRTMTAWASEATETYPRAMPTPLAALESMRDQYARDIADAVASYDGSDVSFAVPRYQVLAALVRAQADRLMAQARATAEVTR